MSSFEPLMRPGDLPAINRERVNARGNEEVVDYLLKLVRALEERVMGQLVHTMNLMLQLMGPGVYYLQLPNPTSGAFIEGDMRFFRNGSAVELQTLDSGGTWQTIWSASY